MKAAALHLYIWLRWLGKHFNASYITSWLDLQSVCMMTSCIYGFTPFDRSLYAM